MRMRHKTGAKILKSQCPSASTTQKKHVRNTWYRLVSALVHILHEIQHIEYFPEFWHMSGVTLLHSSL
jgi:hypothetical protein